MLIILLSGIALVRVSVLYGNFNCGFSMISNNLSYDYISVLLIFVVFELEILVVLIVVNVALVLVVVGITYYELLINIVS